MIPARAAAVCLAALIGAAGPALATPGAWTGGNQGRIKPPFDEVGIDQRLGEPIPLDLEFLDEEGRRVRLGDYFGDRPVILTLAYFRCPMLCSLVVNGMTGALGVMSLEPGDDFEMVTVSIDPRETPEMARASKKGYVERYGREGARAGWHFLTGEAEAIEALAGAAGFRYVYDPATDQFAHASAILVITPQGRIAQYFMGIEFPPRDLRLALVESSQGTIGTLVDRLILLCYEYDPATGRYGAMTMRLVRTGGVITVLGMAIFVSLMLRRDARRRAGPPGGSEGGAGEVVHHVR